ncbi:MAG TPA: right-handed parallel beta-helix repeat-containing protein [Puia sp.]|nr:right-handed parallel beta-helix repeat-containing protein [Puia sp.]
MRTYSYFLILLVLSGMTCCCPMTSNAQPFVHPGINQTSADLDYMRKMVLDGRQPWKDAFDRLKSATDTTFIVKAHTHVLRGPYGRPNIGGDDLSKCANMAYNDALVWYITRDKKYADKAIDILNAWSSTLWDFDYNDAKLLAAWTGHLLCNAAEILRYTNTGWQQKDIAAFTHLLTTVYYPLMRPYYPQANGNWDGAIIHSLMAIAVFTDNRPLFNNAVDHFKHAPVNGSIFKYIYPNGECQESPRDQGHVQLGIGEFAGAAQVAYTQGVDLFSMANNRIALGFEYTARFLLGETPYCYCTISQRGKVLRDDYEYVYRHYTARGVDMPYTKRAADSVRPRASRSILTAVRASFASPLPNTGPPRSAAIAYIAGAGNASPRPSIPTDARYIAPGQSIQQALDAAAASGGSKWVVLRAGIHTIPATLKIPSGITIMGQGDSTILFLDPASGQREAMINADTSLHDVTIRNLIIEGGNKTEVPSDPNSSRSFKGGYNRGGILFRGEREGQLHQINFIGLTVRNSTYSGISVSGAGDITITSCDLSENGASVPPGPGLTHNLLLEHCADVHISGSRLATSPFGCGAALDHCSNVSITGCEIARNGSYGVLLSESRQVTLQGCLIEANDHSGVIAEHLFKGNDHITVTNNRIQYNNGDGVEMHAAQNSSVENNTYEGNGDPIDHLGSLAPPGHPRILLLQGEENAVKKTIGGDKIWMKMQQAIVAESDRMIALPPVERIKIGRRLLDKSREALRRLFFLSYAYRTTRDRKYLQRAEKEMKAIAAFSDWNPSHFLDVAEMTMAMSIGYDWLYDGLSKDTRATIRDAILHKGIEPSLDPKNNGWLTVEHNWNPVCNAGMTYGALAIYEDSPALAKQIINRAIEDVVFAMKDMGPDGNYPEGYGYWGYGTSFNVLLISALDKAFGKDFGLSDMPGFLKTAGFLENMTGPTGKPFNFSDVGEGGGIQPAMFWFAQKNEDPSLLWVERSRLLNEDARRPIRDRLLPAMMIWGKGIPIESIHPPKSRMWVGRGKNPVALMRTSWTDSSAIYIGMKGGAGNVNHAHMDVGSFVMDADGVRWAMDLGAQNYESLESKGMQIFGRSQDAQRWTIFRYVNQAHNTLTVNDQHQWVKGYAPITGHSSSPEFMSAQTDLSEVYKGSLSSARRGIAIVDGRWVVVRDEITAADTPAVVRWTLLTSAHVKITGSHSAELTKDGKKLFLRVDGPGDITMKIWPTDPPPNSYDAPNPGTIRTGFEFTLPAGSSAAVTVSLIPEHAAATAIKNIGPLATWKQDGQ